MRKFTASMISKGNHLFQASITILDNGVKLRIPNFWRDQETFFSFNDISGVELTTPSWYSVLTYSTINFNLRGTWVEAHGFAKSDAITIKRMIEGGRQSGGNSSINEFGEDTNKFSGYKQQQWINYQHDREVKKDREERVSRENEQNKELIPKLKKLIIKYWIEILRYGDNSDYTKLSDMVSPSSNKNATVELSNYLNKLKRIILDIYGEEYWEIEYDSINDEMWVEINENTRAFILRKALTKYDEGVAQAREIVPLYDNIDISILENECLNYPKISNFFIDALFVRERRSALIRKLEEKIKILKEWDDDYRRELLNLLILIDLIYSSYVYSEKDDDGKKRYNYALDSKSIKSFLSDSTVSLNKKLSKIIDCTDNFIDRIAKDLGI
jgi:hypothetical protein